MVADLLVLPFEGYHRVSGFMGILGYLDIGTSGMHVIEEYPNPGFPGFTYF